MSFCHKLRFSHYYNLATRFPRPLIFQTINSARSNSLSLKYQRFTPSGCKDIGVRKFKFAAKTQFLYVKIIQGGNKKSLTKNDKFGNSKKVFFLNFRGFRRI